MQYVLIHHQAVGKALEKAKQYRTLLEPDLAISICLDIFAIEKNHQETLVVYILAFTDTFSKPNIKTSDKKIKQAITELKNDYQQNYYTGIFQQKKARSLTSHAMSGSFAYHLLLEAIANYETTDKLSQADNDDAILRRNSCVRIIQDEHLQLRQDLDDVYWQIAA